MTSQPSHRRSALRSGGMRLLIGLTAIPLGLGMLAGCNTAEDAGWSAGNALSAAPLSEGTLEEAELVRLANALSWKQRISGDEAFAIVRKASARGNAGLARYRKIEREHEQFLRRQRLEDFDKSNGGGGGSSGGGGGHAH